MNEAALLSMRERYTTTRINNLSEAIHKTRVMKNRKEILNFYQKLNNTLRFL